MTTVTGTIEAADTSAAAARFIFDGPDHVEGKVDAAGVFAVGLADGDYVLTVTSDDAVRAFAVAVPVEDGNPHDISDIGSPL